MSRSDHVSLHSFATSSGHTAVSEPQLFLDEDRPPHYLDDMGGFPQNKSLPALPAKEKQRSLNTCDAHGAENSACHVDSFRASIHPLTTITQLSAALGPDNTPHSTEIDAIPCSGVRIPYGPLTGLLAWRLVVRGLPPAKDKRTWWNHRVPQSVKEDRRKSLAIPRPSPYHVHSSSGYDPPITLQISSEMSTLSLPLTHLRANPESDPTSDSIHQYSDAFSALPHSRPAKTFSADGVVTNFILDTSLPYSIISRDTLLALGYPFYKLPPYLKLDPHTRDFPDDQDTAVTLSVQGVLTRFRIARPGEASRLGVQFFQDAGVSLFFPTDREGVGPVLYLESARSLQDVPRTVSLPNGTRATGMGKLTLPQRVRTLFGLT